MSLLSKQGCRTCRFTLNERDADRLRDAAKHAGFKDLDTFAHGLVQMGLGQHEKARAAHIKRQSEPRMDRGFGDGRSWIARLFKR